MGDLIGKTVRWTSQSGGGTKTKQGKVLDFVPARVSVYSNRSYLFRGVSQSRIKFEERSSMDRYLVAVPRTSDVVDYYAPRASSAFEVVEGY